MNVLFKKISLVLLVISFSFNCYSQMAGGMNSGGFDRVIISKPKVDNTAGKTSPSKFCKGRSCVIALFVGAVTVAAVIVYGLYQVNNSNDLPEFEPLLLTNVELYELLNADYYDLSVAHLSSSVSSTSLINSLNSFTAIDSGLRPSEINLVQNFFNELSLSSAVLGGAEPIDLEALLNHINSSTLQSSVLKPEVENMLNSFVSTHAHTLTQCRNLPNDLEKFDNKTTDECLKIDTNLRGNFNKDTFIANVQGVCNPKIDVNGKASKELLEKIGKCGGYFYGRTVANQQIVSSVSSLRFHRPDLILGQALDNFLSRKNGLIPRTIIDNINNLGFSDRNKDKLKDIKNNDANKARGAARCNMELTDDMIMLMASLDEIAGICLDVRANF